MGIFQVSLNVDPFKCFAWSGSFSKIEKDFIQFMFMTFLIFIRQLNSPKENDILKILIKDVIKQSGLVGVGASIYSKCFVNSQNARKYC